MQDKDSTMFDDGFGTPTLPTGVFSKILYFYYDRMPWSTHGWEAYFGLPAEVPEY